MKWYQKKLRGWVVPFWVTDMPLVSFRASQLSDEDIEELRDKFVMHK